MIIHSNQPAFFKATSIKFREGQNPNYKLPKTIIGFYSRHLLERFLNLVYAKPIGYISTANFEKDIYLVNYKSKVFGLFMAGVGGPLISADIEELSASGAKNFIIFGNCGVLNNEIEDLKIIIPTLAYRDEGTSQHYVKDSETISVNENYKEEFIQILQEFGVDYEIGPTWTTDAFYRETPDKIAYFKSKGCLSVEMEASTISAVCKYKGLNYFTFFYAGDNLDTDEWDQRSLRGLTKIDEKEKIPFLAFELGYRIQTEEIVINPS